MRVLVAGAGVIGCAVGWELARRGATVTIADPRRAGGGATQASAGMLVPYHEAEHAGPFRALAERSLSLYDDFIERLTSLVTDARIDYSRTGALEIAFDEATAVRQRARAAELDAAGIESRWLSADEARVLEPRLADAVRGGLLVSTEGHVSPDAMTDALARAAVLSGASVVQNAVHGVQTSGSVLRAETDEGIFEADRVVVAAGSWSGQVEVEGDTPLPVRPVRGQLVRLDWPGPPLAQIVWSPRCYMVPRRDGTLLVGATVEDVGFDERPTVGGVRDLLDAACEAMPDTRLAGFREVRVGLRPAAPDGLPILGRSPATAAAVYATGHYRNGVLLAPVTAALVADLVLDDRLDPMLAAFSPGRFS
jgi:glycine oxidase